MRAGFCSFGRPFGQTVVLLAIALTGCRAPVPGSVVSTPGPRNQETHRFPDRPSLFVIERQGDPFSAVSWVVGHGLDGVQARSLASWLEQRTKREGLPRVRVMSDASALKIDALVESSFEASRFVTFVDSALREPGVSPWFRPEPFSLPLSNIPQIAAGTAAASVFQCAGELYLAEGRTQNPLSDAELLPLRASVAARPSAFAAVGSAEVLEAVQKAVLALPPRALRSMAAVRGERALSVLPSSIGGSRLRVAWFAPQLGSVGAAREEILSEHTTLLARMAGLPAHFQLESAQVHPVPGGACLLLDWLTPEFVSLAQASFALRVLDKEFSVFSAKPQSLDAASESSEALPGDPRELASAAAWRLVTEASPPSNASMSTVLEVPASRSTPPRATEYPLDGLLGRLQGSSAGGHLELRNRAELGQPEFWMLVGSVCSERPASNANAAAEALWLRTLTTQFQNIEGVTIEPWISTLGLGLLGHARPRDLRETGAELATRVATSLGRLVAATELSPLRLGSVRSQLLSELERANPVGWWWMLDELTAGQAWRLDGHTTPEILSDLTLAPVARHRSLFLGGPLRVATLSNVDPSQAQTAATTFAEWAAPYTADPLKCQSAETPSWDFGERRMPSGGSAATAYVLVPFGPESRAAARLVTVLVNRGLARTFEADVDGSKAIAEGFDSATGFSMVVKVSAPEAEMIRAVARVRTVLGNMAEGGTTANDLDWAKARAGALDQLRRLDPRVRTAELWTGQTERVPSLQELQTALGGLAPDRHMVALPPPKNP